MSQPNININQSVKAEQKVNWPEKIKHILLENRVVLLFVALCLVCIHFSGMTWGFILSELVTRVMRNSFLVLALIIPVLAGMGLNFGIVIGAMAGQIAIIAVTHWELSGMSGLMICMALSVPFALLFGALTGMVMNRTKGQEMITGMIMGYFANGLYQLLFLFLVGTIIPMNNPVMILSSGVGIKNTVDLTDSIKYALENAFGGNLKFSFVFCMLAIFAVLMIVSLYQWRKKKSTGHLEQSADALLRAIGSMVIVIIFAIISTQTTMINMIKVPLATVCLIVLVCGFNILIVKTKLGQNFRAVGQNMHIAEVAGINVNKTRVVAIMISTVLAAWGQIIYMQNMGTLNTYGAHEQVGMYAIAALLVGGASVKKATVGQALIGTVLFHTLFISAPLAGKELFGNAQIGEYFRVFVAYGVIGVSLALHAWNTVKNTKEKKA